MSAYKRKDVAKMLKDVRLGRPCSIFLIIGDRFLCQQVAEQLIAALPDDKGGSARNLKNVDGEQENALNTLNMFKTYSMFSSRQIIRVKDSKLFQAKAVDEQTAGLNSPAGKDVTELYMEAVEGGIPEGNILILLAETVDKRKKFYKFILKNGVVADLSVAAGNSRAAKTDQEAVLKELVLQTMMEFGKKIEPRAVPVLLERVGFHPVAVVRETEKLALYIGDAEMATLADLQEIVGRTKEDALFELTEAFADYNLDKALILTTRLTESGVHPLVLVAGLRNQIRKLLLVCSFRESPFPVFVEGMTYAVFQKGYLPELKEAKEEWLSLLPNHPYALYMLFDKVKKHSPARLAASLSKLLQVEYRLKSSAMPPKLVFENFLWQTMNVSGR